MDNLENALKQAREDKRLAELQAFASRALDGFALEYSRIGEAIFHGELKDAPIEVQDYIRKRADELRKEFGVAAKLA